MVSERSQVVNGKRRSPRTGRRSPAICHLPSAIFIAIALLGQMARGETFRVFGSAGAEAQLTPANESSPLNPGNLVDIPRTTNVADVAAFAEAFPDDHAWKTRLKVRADASDRAADTLRVDEGYLQLNLRSWLDVTAGRVIEKWGTGYAWNPTGFINPAKNPTDPNDRRSSYRGLDMLKADLFVRGTNVSFYAMEHGAFAGRVYRLMADTDVSLHFRRDPGQDREGVSAARVFGDALELHAEVARIDDGRTYARALAGGQYTFHNATNVVVELYHGGDGRSGAEWRAFRDSVASARTEADLLAANLAYAPLRMGRDYGFVRVDTPWDSQKNDLELIAIASLRDASSIIRITYTRKLRPNLTAYIIETEFAARRDAEMAYMQVKRVTNFGMRLYF